MKSRPIHPDFQFLLDMKRQPLIDLFSDLRKYILEICPESNEILYHTHALTAVFSISDKLSDGFCMVPIKHGLLTGTGKLVRHIDVEKKGDYRNPRVKALIEEAIAYVIDDMDKPSKAIGETITKIK